ncbi:MAG: putative toxin-antitoxin system toxin component, PIN family [Bacteroidota bacterium]
MKKNNCRIVLDTNVFIVSLLPHFSYYWIYENFLNGNYNLLLSTEILNEYEEQTALRYGIKKTQAQLDFLLLLPNVKHITPYFYWNLIESDASDNKFVDCAVSGNADYVVTEDKHFNVLKKIKFPHLPILNIQGFRKLLGE